MKIVTILSALLFSHTIFAEQHQNVIDEGQALFMQYCASCHGELAGIPMNKRPAPPIFMVKRHYTGTYPDEMTFVDAMADWVETRDVSTSLMPGAIRRYNLMPEIVVERSKVEKIAAYIFNTRMNLPASFEHHYKRQHGLN
ncbi:MAG: c-type cytochrome [Gammaproteobacteria bacterium]|nr:c-type cytochrome [Gammaproteobacteria bacterium]